MPGKPKNSDLIRVEDVPALVTELTGVVRGKPVVYHWIKRGRISRTGQLIKLKATKRMGNLFTTRKWLQEFIDEVG